MSKKKALFDTYEITTQGIKDFQACELYYDLEHQEQDSLQAEIYTHDSILNEKYEAVLKKIAFFYFHKKQGGLVPSFDSLVRRWERLWFPKDMDAYEMSISKQSVKKINLKDYSNMAVASLESFYDEFDDDISIPISIDEDVYVPVDKHIRIVARPNLVLYNQESESYRVVHLIGSRRNKPLSSYQIDLAVNRMAFEYHHTPEDNASTTYEIYNLGTPKTGFHNVQFPTDEHLRACVYWVSKIASKKYFVPRRGFSSYCRGCKFDTQCLNYKWEEVDDVK